PDNKVFSPKVFYLRGLVAEKLDDMETAQAEYAKAIAMYKYHARSHLRIADILLRESHLKEASPHLELITSEPGLLSPPELARAYYLDAIVKESSKNWEVALGDIQRAIRLDKNNPDYALEFYSLKAKGGESVALIRNDARMYYFMG